MTMRRFQPGRSDRPAAKAHRNPLHSILASFLAKLAKHLALIGCLLIVGSATGRASAGQAVILFIVAMAAAAHSGGQFLRRRAEFSAHFPPYRP